MQGIKKFSDFAEPERLLEGDKESINAIINKEIVVLAYKLNKSKIFPDKKCAMVQYVDTQTDQKHIFFTSSQILIDQLTRYEEQLPFSTIIKKNNKYYTFS